MFPISNLSRYSIITTNTQSPSFSEWCKTGHSGENIPYWPDPHILCLDPEYCLSESLASVL
eukprot:c54560_g1_i1 orf=196-378(-)